MVWKWNSSREKEIMKKHPIRYYIKNYSLIVLGFPMLTVALVTFTSIATKYNVYKLLSSLTKRITDFQLPNSFISINKYVLSVILYLVLLGLFICFLRKHYSDSTFHDDSNYYDDDPFFIFYIARLCGFKKINPINIPIWIQIKLVLKTNFKFDFKEYSNTEEKGDIKKFNFRKNIHQDEFNVILEDTYPISLEMISREKNNLPSVKIRRGHFKSGSHLYNKWFVEQFSQTIDSLIRQNPRRLNFYCSTNPTHTYDIFKNLLDRMSRQSNISIYVYQPREQNNQFFYNEGHKIM